MKVTIKGEIKGINIGENATVKLKIDPENINSNLLKLRGKNIIITFDDRQATLDDMEG